MDFAAYASIVTTCGRNHRAIRWGTEETLATLPQAWPDLTFHLLDAGKCGPWKLSGHAIVATGTRLRCQRALRVALSSGWNYACA